MAEHMRRNLPRFDAGVDGELLQQLGEPNAGQVTRDWFEAGSDDYSPRTRFTISSAMLDGTS